MESFVNITYWAQKLTHNGCMKIEGHFVLKYMDSHSSERRARGEARFLGQPVCQNMFSCNLHSGFRVNKQKC